MLRLTYGNSSVYDVNFRTINDHVVEVTGPKIIFSDTGFTLSRIDADDNWDYTDYTTCYRAIDGGYQFSNDGSIYIPPDNRVDVTVYANWYDEGNYMNLRPDKVTFRILSNGIIFDTIKLSASTDWKYTFKIDKDAVVTIIPEQVPNYIYINNGLFIDYKLNVPTPGDPSTDEIMEALTDCYEVAESNVNDITDLQMAVAEIYELIGGIING